MVVASVLAVVEIVEMLKANSCFLSLLYFVHLYVAVAVHPLLFDCFVAFGEFELEFVYDAKVENARVLFAVVALELDDSLPEVACDMVELDEVEMVDYTELG